MARIARPWFYKQTGWWMVYVNGRKEKLAEGRANKKQALIRLNELQLQALTNPAPESPQQTVASVIEGYQDFASRRLAASTVAMRWPYLQSFAEKHGWRPISQCRPEHMDQWLDEHPGWKSDWTKNSAIRNVQVAFNWAVKIGRRIKENPFAGVTHHTGEPRRDVYPEEFQAILRASGESAVHWKKTTPGARFRQILIFLRFTGCRPSEAAKLLWSDIDWRTNCIVLKKHKTARTQKTPRPRVIPMHPVVVKLLQLLQRRTEADHVFLNRYRRPWKKDALVLRMMRARETAGVPSEAKLYGVRHAFGTRAILNAVDIKTVAELMGHTSTRTTEGYLHLAGQSRHLAAAMLQANGHRPGA